jgi:murein DD-endopeptidase MepM/ murein hydrolase activator NlpD
MDRLQALPLVLVIGVVTVAALLASALRPTEPMDPHIRVAATSTPDAQVTADPPATATPTLVGIPTFVPNTAPAPQSGAAPPALPADVLQFPAGAGSGQAANPQTDSDAWNPPSFEVPLALHPFDHYWFIRPVDSAHVNHGLPTYQYGSNGHSNDLRIHHGIDIVNPVGVPVLAAGPGQVIWADKGLRNEYESISAYGNVVVIEHDFGYQGRPLYTLYAHLSDFLVRRGQHVEAGEPIALIGSTGASSGPHVHFEVRVGRNSYWDTRNPSLWIAPYVGTGVIAGRITYASGEPIDDLPLDVVDLSTGQTILRGSNYAGFGVNPDDNWNETFVVEDVPAGTYRVVAKFGGTVYSGEVTVIPGMTNWVEITAHYGE